MYLPFQQWHNPGATPTYCNSSPFFRFVCTNLPKIRKQLPKNFTKNPTRGDELNQNNNG